MGFGLTAMLLGLAAASPAQPAAAEAQGCLVDQQIPAAERAEIDAAAMTFFKGTLGPDTAKAYDQLAEGLKANVSRADFTELFDKVVKPMAPFDPITVAHSYRPLAKGAAGAYAKQACGELLLNTGDGEDSAYVLVNGKARNNDWAFTVWLGRTPQGWRVNGFGTNPSTMVGRTYRDLWDLAKAQGAKGHALMAMVLYGAAEGLTKRGEDFQIRDAATLQAEMQAAPRAAETRDGWSWDGKSFPIVRFDSVGIAGKIYLMVVQRLPEWPGDKEADARNKAMLAAFRAAHPEYREVFAGLIGQAQKPDGSGYYNTVGD